MKVVLGLFKTDKMKSFFMQYVVNLWNLLPQKMCGRTISASFLRD